MSYESYRKQATYSTAARLTTSEAVRSKTERSRSRVLGAQGTKVFQRRWTTRRAKGQARV